jgi:ribonuclease-3 family protein
MKRILPLLTETEESYFRRGRNLGHGSVPKRATVSEYRAATGMEALFGYLHLTGQEERIRELFSLAYPQSEEQ